MDFDLRSDHTALADTVRSFVRTEVRPYARAWDEEGAFPAATVARLGELGLMGVTVPKEYGGVGMDTVGYCAALKEIGKADGSLGLTVASHNSLCAAHILSCGSEALRRTYLPELASGRMLGAWALTEPGSGSDALGMRSRATWSGDRWILNGTKMFTTQGSVAGVYVILAVTDRERGRDGVTAFLVEAGTPGLTTGRTLHKLGMRASDTAEIVFENLAIPPANVIGEVHSGFRDAIRNLPGGRISIAALAVGIGTGALEDAKVYAARRRQFDREISSFQAVRRMIADSGTEMEAAWLLTLRAAWLKDAGRPHVREAAIAKLVASEAAMRTTIRTVQIFGGYGCTREFPAERAMRDAKLCEIGEGTSEVQRMIIARRMVRETGSA